MNRIAKRIIARGGTVRDVINYFKDNPEALKIFAVYIADHIYMYVSEGYFSLQKATDRVQEDTDTKEVLSEFIESNVLDEDVPWDRDEKSLEMAGDVLSSDTCWDMIMNQVTKQQKYDEAAKLAEAQ